MSRIGIIVSDFDPVHQGYIELAKKSIHLYQLSKVLFLITSLNSESIDLSYRKTILKSTLRPYRKMEGQLYQDYLNKDDNYILIGSDSLKRSEIADQKRIHLEKGNIENQCLLDCEKIHSGDFSLLKTPIRSYLISHGIYVNSIVAHFVKKKRYIHCCSVAKLSAEIANAHHLDGFRAYLVGMLHDIAKDFSMEDCQYYLKLYHPYEENYNAPVWHQFIGMIYLKRYFKWRDKKALKAIRHHCLGDDKDVYSKIIFIADKLDPSRGYDSSKEIALALKDLDRGYEVVVQQNKEYLENKGIN